MPENDNSWRYREREANKRAVWAFVQGFIDENAYPPTFREIGDALGWSATTVQRLLDWLMADGVLERRWKTPRSIRLLKRLPPEG